MYRTAFAFLVLLASESLAARQPDFYCLEHRVELDRSVLHDDVVVTGTATPSEYAVTETISSAPVSLAAETAGLVRGTTEDAGGAATAARIVDAELARATRTLSP